MTIRDRFTERLVASGLWEAEARAVMEAVEKDEANEAMRDRWGDQSYGYPAVTLAIAPMFEDEATP